jgi:hypothetical protein
MPPLVPYFFLLGAVPFIGETFQASHSAAYVMMLSGVGIAQYGPATDR